jgi:putative ABC transport system permease protein
VFTNLEQKRGATVALIGISALQQLAMSGSRLPETVYIDGSAFLIEGIVSGAQRHSEVLVSVVIPSKTAQRLFGRAFDSDAPPSLSRSRGLGMPTPSARRCQPRSTLLILKL